MEMKSKVIIIKYRLLILTLTVVQAIGISNSFAQPTNREIRGDSAAIADLKSMVNTMGGMQLWSQLKSVHFVHRWYFWDRDSYLENEILDLTASRSWVTMKNETYSRIRAYSPEHRYWNIINGEFSYTTDEAFKNAMERAPYNIYRIARAVAIGDAKYRVEFGREEFKGAKRIEIYGPDEELHGYIVLNAKKEPLVWATTQYKYTFGPMKSFGNLSVPNWAVTGDGAITYEMISLTVDNQTPDLQLFIPPQEFRKR